MADSGLARAGTLLLARQRLQARLRKVAELARLGNIPDARKAMDYAMSDLDDIASLLREEAEDA